MLLSMECDRQGENLAVKVVEESKEVFLQFLEVGIYFFYKCMYFLSMHYNYVICLSLKFFYSFLGSLDLR